MSTRPSATSIRAAPISSGPSETPASPGWQGAAPGTAIVEGVEGAAPGPAAGLRGCRSRGRAVRRRLARSRRSRRTRASLVLRERAFDFCCARGKIPGGALTAVAAISTCNRVIQLCSPGARDRCDADARVDRPSANAGRHSGLRVRRELQAAAVEGDRASSRWRAAPPQADGARQRAAAAQARRASARRAKP